MSDRTLGSRPPLVRALGQVKLATARANRAAGVIAPDIAAAIERAAGELAAGAVDPNELNADLLGGGGSIAVHVEINDVLARRAGVEVAAVNASQSTADVCHTAHRLAVLGVLGTLIEATAATIVELRLVAERFAAIPTLARTCLRDAMAVPLSTVFTGSADALDRRCSALVVAGRALHHVALGTTVIGRGDGAPERYRAVVVGQLAEITGLPLEAHPTPASALQHGDDLAALSSAVVHLSQPLLKLAGDLRLLSSGPQGGFGEVVLPHVMDGSSFFAGKSNPVVPETVIQACLQVRGFDHTVQLAVDRSELYLNVLDGLMTVDVLDELNLLTRSFVLMTTFVLADLTADEARCAELEGFAAPTKAEQP